MAGMEGRQPTHKDTAFTGGGSGGSLVPGGTAYSRERYKADVTTERPAAIPPGWNWRQEQDIHYGGTPIVTLRLVNGVQQDIAHLYTDSRGGQTRWWVERESIASWRARIQAAREQGDERYKDIAPDHIPTSVTHNFPDIPASVVQNQPDYAHREWVTHHYSLSPNGDEERISFLNTQSPTDEPEPAHTSGEKGEQRPRGDQAGSGGGNGESGEPIAMIAVLAQWNRENPPKQYVETITRQQTLADYMFGRVMKIEDDIRRFGDTYSRETAWKVKWSYLSIALPFMFPEGQEDLRQSVLLENYERMRKEQRARGEETPGIELSFTQVKTLQFVLDEAEVPIKLGDSPVCILLYPLEHVMQSIELRERRREKEEDNQLFAPWQQQRTEETTVDDPHQGTVIDFTTERDKRRPQP